MTSIRLHKGYQLGRWLWPLALVFTLSVTTLRADSELQAVRDLLQAGEYLTAIALLEDLNDLRPCDADLLFLQARIYESVGEIDTAIGLYQTLINNFPNLPEPYNNIAVLYAARGKLKEAKAFLQRGLSTHDSYRSLQKNLSTVYVVEAAESYRRALSVEFQQVKFQKLERPTPNLLEVNVLLGPLSPLIQTKLESECQPTKQ